MNLDGLLLLFGVKHFRPSVNITFITLYFFYMNKNYTTEIITAFAKAIILMALLFLDYGAVYMDTIVEKNNLPENSFIEWWEEIQLLIIIITLVVAGTKHKNKRSLISLLAGMASMGLIREYNNFLNDHLFHGAWSAGVLIVGCITAWLVYKERATLSEAIYDFVERPSYGMILAGFLTSFVFSRMLGIPWLWKTILNKNYVRIAERIAEESVELLGYSFIAFGMATYLLSLNREKKLSSSPKEKISQ